MDTALIDYFRCPREFAGVDVAGNLSGQTDFFRFGPAITCYGQYCNGSPSGKVDQRLEDMSSRTHSGHGRVELPFDLNQIVNNLRYERYASHGRPSPWKFTDNHAAGSIYYCLRPILPVTLRKHLQRLRLRGWEEITFPRWPVDFTVDTLMQTVLALILKARGMTSMPFIWFWPDGVPSCAMMTHDVEDKAGLAFCNKLMNLDNRFAIKSAFQFIPEMRYEIPSGFLESLRTKGFEINVHDLNHDGGLFREKEEFMRRAKKINHYVSAYNAEGFRTGAMYRNQDWYDAFAFSYDMSVPNVAHLEPQRGGCCTVMPYFIGKILELPLTTIQDYSLFHILDDHSINLWKQQIELIMRRNGLISFITHPDYLIDKRAQAVYMDLLSHLATLRDQRKLWTALPREVNRWWRNRHHMRLVQDGDNWRIEGPDSERARIAYATLEGESVVYSVATETDPTQQARSAESPAFAGDRKPGPVPE